MKKLAAILFIISVLAFPHLAFSQWVPLRVNTNTWECKPEGASFTNYWDEYGAETVTPGDTSETAPTSTPPISVESPYYDAEMWWDFVADNGTATNVVDASGNGEDGHEISHFNIDYNQPIWTDYCVHFDRTAINGIESDSTDLLFGATRCTVALWVKPGVAFYPANINPLFTASTTGATIFSLRHINTHPTNTITAADGTSAAVTNAVTATVGEWLHLAVTKKFGGNFVVYSNAVEVGSVSTGGALYTDESFILGGIPGASPVSINAFFDDFALWSRILSTNDLAAIVANGRSTNATWYSDSEW
jgi:hypothetical protein